MSPTENSSSAAMNSSSSSSMSVTLPPGLVFLISNFHSFVNLKLDSTNYLLWRIQVENMMSANGFYEYLEGLIPCPAPQIKNADGTLVINPEYTLWKLIDTQLLTCITASLSPETLPYILGLRTAHTVWESLANRYNTLSKNHVQELKSKLYNITKTSTIENYVDTIKGYTQKLIAAGSPLDEDDLIFHTLRGLPRVFNGLRTTVRAMQTRGEHVTFDEVVNMLHAENQQLLQDSTTELDTGTVLVATNKAHGNASSLVQSFGHLGVTNQGPASVQSSMYPFSQVQPTYGGHPNSVLGPPPQTVHALSQSSGVSQIMTPQSQFYPTYSSGFKGKGRRPPCAICGRTNHTTHYCYYKSQAPQASQVQGQSVPWGNTQWQNVQPNQWSNNQSAQWGNTYQPVPMYQPPPVPMYQPPPVPVYQQSIPPPQLSQNQNSQPLAYQQGMSQPNGFGRPSAPAIQAPIQAPIQAHFAGFTEHCSAPVITSSTGFSPGQPMYPSGVDTGTAISVGTAGSAQVASPWYFDSGATNHITNNLQHVINPQPAAPQDGIMVGNGSHLQVSHTGQDYSSNLVPGTLPQGSVSSSDLL